MFVNIDPYTKFIRIWLLSIFSLVIIIIIVGGLTRLTDSGLSITEWELFKGVLPPLDVEKWNFYFNEYKKIPEFKSINYNMTLDEFKVIYYWEYAHRLIARLIGLVSILPIALEITSSAPVLPADTTISASLFLTLSIASHILVSLPLFAPSKGPKEVWLV